MDRDWTKQGLCYGTPEPGLWDGDKLPRPSPLDPQRRARHAKALCTGCPVIRECARDARDTDATSVIRAGVELKLMGRNHETYKELERIANTKRYDHASTA